MILKLERLKNRLEANRLKPTYQRIKILEYLNKHMNDHPTVEMIYEALSQKIPTISMATIYNTLNAFLEKGLAFAVTITGTEVRYDVITSPHHHLLCKRCGRIIDIDIKCPFALCERKVIKGHTIEQVHGYFKGICKDCSDLKKKKSAKGRAK